jgi:hypothetical protein
MRKLMLGVLAAGAAMAIAGCNREEKAEEANTAVVEETVPPSESAENLDAAATNLDSAAENMANADAAATNADANATDLGSTDH